MPQLFRPVANTVARVILTAAFVSPLLAMGAGYAVMHSEYITAQSITIEQPVPFSHAHHVGGLGLDCRYCHTSVEAAAFAGKCALR